MTPEVETHDSNERSQDQEDAKLEDYDFIASKRNRRKKKTKEETKDSSNSERVGNDRDNVTSSNKAAPAVLRDSSTQCQLDQIPSTSSASPSRFIQSDVMPTFQFNIPLKFDLRLDNSDIRGISNMYGSTQHPPAYPDYGRELWAENIPYYSRARGTAYINNNDISSNMSGSRREEWNATANGCSVSAAVNPNDCTDASRYWSQTNSDRGVLNNLNLTPIQKEETAHEQDTKTPEHKEKTSTNHYQENDVSKPIKVDIKRNSESVALERASNGDSLAHDPERKNLQYGSNEHKAVQENILQSNKGIMKPDNDFKVTNNVSFSTKSIMTQTEISQNDKASAKRDECIKTKSDKQKSETFSVSVGTSTFNGINNAERPKHKLTHDSKMTLMKEKANEQEACFTPHTSLFHGAELPEMNIQNGHKTAAEKMKSTENNRLRRSDDAFGKPFDYHSTCSSAQCIDREHTSNEKETKNKILPCFTENSQLNNIKTADALVIPAFIDSNNDIKDKFRNTAIGTEKCDDKNAPKFVKGENIDVNKQKNNKKAEVFFVSFGPSAFDCKDKPGDVENNLSKMPLNKKLLNETAMQPNGEIKEKESFFIPTYHASESDKAKQEKSVSCKETPNGIETEHSGVHNHNQEKTESQRNDVKAETFFVSSGPSTSDAKGNVEDLKVNTDEGFSNNTKPILDYYALEERPLKKSETLFVPLREENKDGSVGYPNEIQQNSDNNALKDRPVIKGEALFVSLEKGSDSGSNAQNNFNERSNATETDQSGVGKYKQEKTDAQRKNVKAEAFFVSFGPSELDAKDNVENLKVNSDESFQNKTKPILDYYALEERPLKKAETLFVPLGEGNEDGSVRYSNEIKQNNDFNALEDRPVKKGEALFVPLGKETEYGSVGHHNKIKTDNAIRKKKLDGIQTKVDSWKTSDSGLTKKPPQYGSVAHNNLIQEDNAIRKKKIESATTKVDSWKTNETDDSYIHSNMKQYKLAPKPAQYGSVAHNNQIKHGNALRKKKLESITTTLDTWKTEETDNSYLHANMRGFEVSKRPAEYGSVEHNKMIKRDNAMRKKRMSKIHTNLDTWNAPNPGSKYSLQRRDEWERVLDPGKYGSVAHFHQIKSDNAMRKKRMSNVRSNLDTWNKPNPGSKYSLKRKDEWEPVYDTRKYGSVAHYHQVKQTHSDNRHMLKNAGTRLCTWQPKSKMNLLNARHQKKTETNNPNMKSLKEALNNVRPKIDSGASSLIQNDHNLTSWSRHVTPDNNFYRPSSERRVPKINKPDYDFDHNSERRHIPERSEPDYDFHHSSRRKYIPERNEPDYDFDHSSPRRHIPEKSEPEYDIDDNSRRRHIPDRSEPEYDFDHSSRRVHISKKSEPENDFDHSSRRRHIPERSEPDSDNEYSSRRRHIPDRSEPEYDFGQNSRRGDIPERNEPEYDFDHSSRQRHVLERSEPDNDFAHCSRRGHILERSEPEYEFDHSSRRRHIPERNEPEDDFDHSSRKRHVLQRKDQEYDFDHNSRRRNIPEKIEPGYFFDQSYWNKHGQNIADANNESNTSKKTSEKGHYQEYVPRDVSELTTHDFGNSSVYGKYIPNRTLSDDDHYQPSWSRYEPVTTREDNRDNYGQSPWSRPVSCRSVGAKKSLIPLPKANPISKYEEMLRGVLRQNQK